MNDPAAWWCPRCGSTMPGGPGCTECGHIFTVPRTWPLEPPLGPDTRYGPELRPLSAGEREGYRATGEPTDKAGTCAIAQLYAPGEIYTTAIGAEACERVSREWT